MVGHLKVLDSKITFLLAINILTPRFPITCALLWLLFSLSSLRPHRTVEKGLRLRSRHPRVSEEASDRAGHAPRHHLGPGALTPLEDEQGSDEDPEEEVDPGCRLGGRRQTGDIKINIWAFTGGQVKYYGVLRRVTSALDRLL